MCTLHQNELCTSRYSWMHLSRGCAVCVDCIEEHRVWFDMFSFQLCLLSFCCENDDSNGIRLTN